MLTVQVSLRFHLHHVYCSELLDILSQWLFAADWSAGTSGRGVLVSEGHRQNTRRQVARSACNAHQVPEAGRLPRQSTLQPDPLRRQGGLQL